MAFTNYYLVQDNDCHWYVIPGSKRQEWEEFLDIPSDDDRAWNVPDFATRVDGPHRVAFTEWREE